jgi:hypothetical protein
MAVDADLARDVGSDFDERAAAPAKRGGGGRAEQGRQAPTAQSVGASRVALGTTTDLLPAGGSVGWPGGVEGRQLRVGHRPVEVGAADEEALSALGAQQEHPYLWFSMRIGSSAVDASL